MQNLMEDRYKTEKKNELNLLIQNENALRKEQLRKKFLMDKIGMAKRMSNPNQFKDYKKDYEDEFDKYSDDFDESKKGSALKGSNKINLVRSNSVEDGDLREKEKKRKEEYVKWINEQKDLDKADKAKMREIKAKDALRKVENARSLEEHMIYNLVHKM